MILKQNDDNKPVIDQVNISNQVEKNQDSKVHDVRTADNADNGEKKFDAREKGSNEYQSNRNGQKKKKAPDGKVVLKNPGGFDLKI